MASLVLEYSFTLVKAKDGPSVLNSCQETDIFQPGFFVIIYTISTIMVQHVEVCF